MFSFGYFPGVRLSFADVSEPSVRSIFKDWMKNQETQYYFPSFNGVGLSVYRTVLIPYYNL
jgi:hypothetical protein